MENASEFIIYIQALKIANPSQTCASLRMLVTRSPHNPKPIVLSLWSAQKVHTSQKGPSRDPIVPFYKGSNRFLERRKVET